MRQRNDCRSPAVRGCVVLVFDTLRKDFETFWGSSDDRDGAAFRRLHAVTRAMPNARCGSFPTVPMRTDALTGTLSFLERRWATPARSDAVISLVAAEAGIRTHLVTDNYMLLVPHLGGVFGPYFQQVDFIRGAGSDPWQPFSAAQAPAIRPSRSTNLEYQYLANSAAWALIGGPPWERLFDAALTAFNHALANERPFLLWIDCFSSHEPWLDLEAEYPSDAPVSPPYGSIQLYTPEQLWGLKKQYSARLRLIDRAMDTFVSQLADEVGRGDVALAVMSDHGFLFGEYELVGKPKGEPVLPELHDLVIRLSSQFDGLAAALASIQPSMIPQLLADVLGFTFPVRGTAGGEFQLIGRNSPETDSLMAVGTDGFLVLSSDLPSRGAQWCAWHRLDHGRCWREQGTLDVPATVLPWPELRRALIGHPWGKRFVDSIPSYE